MLGTAAGFRPPTARLRLRRPSDARSAKRGEPMPARLRVRRRSLNAPQAGAAACQAAFGAAGFSPPTSRLRLRGVRATRGARSEEITCARHRRHAMVSRASFAFPRGHASRATVRGVNARVPTLGLAPGCPSISIWLANGAKVGTLLWLGTFIVWIVHGSATTFPTFFETRSVRRL